ncbi:MAG: (Fe-S)-binding protein [Spirochaetes bacterium]|nr:(Fe-S)-binding protein [Spirochaetota bacterium]
MDSKNEGKQRYYKPRAEVALDIEDMENFVYDMSRCIKCKGCTWVDHTYMPGAKFMTRCPSATMYEYDAYGAYGKMRIAHGMAEGKVEWNDKALEIMYACTLCGACDVGCKRNLDLEVELTLESIRVKAVKDGVGPLPAHKKIAENVKKTGNMFGSSKKRTEWIPADAKPADKADVLYFVGCTASYTNHEIAQSTAKIFKAAKVNYMLLKDESCCGNAIFSSGMVDEAREIAKKNVEAMKKSGAKKLVTACAEGYRMWKVDYPKLLNIATADLGFEVLHLVEFVDELVKNGSLKMKKEFNTRMVYHDACSLSRLSEPWTPWEGKRGWMGCVEPRLKRRRGTNGVYEQPRDILKAIPGVDLVSLPRERENAYCCGAGRGTKEAFPEFAKWNANHRLEEIRDAGAETLVTACPMCKNNFAQNVKENGNDMQVMDISEVICSAIES